MRSTNSRFLCLVAAVVFLVSTAPKTLARPVPMAYKETAAVHQVPADIWFAILQQESCIPLSNAAYCLPWPWTLNIDHESYYFQDYQSASEALSTAINQGSKVAIGLGQIYWPAHKGSFEDPRELLTIQTNLDYSATFFKQQYLRSEDWWVAVGMYHAPNDSEAAEHYRSKVRSRWEAWQ